MHAFANKLISTSERDISTTMTPIQSEIVDSESEMLPPSDPDESTNQLHRTTILRCAKGEIQSRKDHHEQYSLLTPAQKKRLIEYINELTWHRLPPTSQNVCTFADNI
jgi:hypothetical protein